MQATQSPVICDSGTGFLKIGWASETFPTHTIPAMVGRPMLRYGQKIDDVELKEKMIGDEAAPYRAMLEINHPVAEGIIKDWDDMNLIWGYAFDKMKIKPEETSILMTEAALNPKVNRMKMAEIVFEGYNFSKMQIGIQALLSLYAEGLETGMLLDAGDGVTHCIPVVQGFIQPHQIKRMNIAGRHITDYLVKLLFQRGYAFNSSADFELVREIKEKYCFASGDLGLERKLAKETTIHEKEVRLPDNTCIKIGKERFEAPEILFNPCVIGSDQLGVSDMVFKSIQECPIDVRRELYGNVVISGGTSMFPGFPTRLSNDLTKIYREKIMKGNKNQELRMKIKIIDPPRRRYNVFIGAGILASSMADQKEYWISKQDYEEYGAERCLAKVQQTI